MVATIGETYSHCTSFDWLRFATFKLSKLFTYGMGNWNKCSSLTKYALQAATGELAGWLQRGKGAHKLGSRLASSSSSSRFRNFEMIDPALSASSALQQVSLQGGYDRRKILTLY